MTPAKKRLPNFPEHAIQVVPTTDREAIPELLSLTQYVDLCMPRGGEGLIRAVADCSKVPVIKHYKGVCHVFVDADADLKMAEEIVDERQSASVPPFATRWKRCSWTKPSPTNFCPVIGTDVLRRKTSKCAATMPAATHFEPNCKTQNSKLQTATEQDYFTEYNDYILNVRVVDGVSRRLTTSIITARRIRTASSRGTKRTRNNFWREVDSAAVYWNASTRFTDGGEFGMGAEIGISTDKIGARGPMGLDELTSYKWIGIGNGQIRT